MKNLVAVFMLFSMFAMLKADEKIEPVLLSKKPVVDKLKALKSNESCFLEAPTILENLGDFGKGYHTMKEFGPSGRDYSLKMVWMPDRKRAFFCGANHQVPNRYNDAWEYDLPSNTWALIYTPDYDDVLPLAANVKDILVVKDGWLRTKNGGPGHPAHTWSGITYDPELKAIVWLCFWPEYRLEQKLSAIGAKQEDLFKGPKVWMFYTQTKKWEPLPTIQPWPQEKYGYSLEYLPEIKKPVYHYYKNSYILDVDKKSWKLVETNGENYAMETIMCFDSKRKQFIAHSGPSDSVKIPTTTIAKAENGNLGPWVKVYEDPNGPVGMDSQSMLQFDQNSGKAFLFHNTTGKLWCFDPDTNKWTLIASTGDQLIKENLNQRVLAYFDQSQNVFVVIGHGWVWCYRP